MALMGLLGKFIVETSFNDLRKEIIEHIKYCILDWLGAAFAGSSEPSSKIIIQYIKELGGIKEATIIKEGFKTSSINAAFANGIIGHSAELDDIYEEAIIHPGAPVIPAALAVAESEESSGKDLITAVALGYETEIRIGRAIMPSHYDYWHPTGTCGTFGSTAAVGSLLKLDEYRMIHALSIASTEAAGLIESFGTMCKPFNAGRAARDGVVAAYLAQKGFTGSNKMLEAKKGYLNATSRYHNLDRLTENLGESYELLRTVFKRHACCGHIHGAIDAVLDIMEKKSLDIKYINEIQVGTYPIASELVGKNYEPKTPAEAKFSLPYCIAAAVIHGKVSLREFSNVGLVTPKIYEIMRKVRVYNEPKYVNAQLGSAKVTIRTTNGEEITKSVDVPKGHPNNPLTKPELEDKFSNLSSLFVTQERIKELLQMIKTLEKIENIQDFSAVLMKKN
jgi:2-methylcitrate dehydratase PrpD